MTHIKLTSKHTYIKSFDPGKVTGYARGFITAEKPLEVVEFAELTYEEMLSAQWRVPYIYDYDEYVVSERFTLRTNNEYAPDLDGVRVEGMLDLMFGGRVRYRERTTKEQVPDSILKEHGLWKTGADVDWTDGRDVNDAIIHLLGFVAFQLKHKPTLRKYFK